MTPQQQRKARGLVVRGPESGSSRKARVAIQERQRTNVARLAEAIFAERGFRGTTIRLVASRARCSVGQIYKLYPSKLDLYRGILEARGVALSNLVDEIAAESGGVRARLEKIVRAVLEFFQANSAFFRIYAMESGARLWPAALSPRSSRLAEMRARGLDRVARLIREGQDAGELRRDLDPMQATVALFGMIKGQAGERVWKRQGKVQVEDADVILELFFRGINGGRRA